MDVHVAFQWSLPISAYTTTKVFDDPLPNNSTDLSIQRIDADYSFFVKELQVGTLVEITVIQDHTTVATPLLRGDLQVLVETKSYLCLSC